MTDSAPRAHPLRLRLGATLLVVAALAGPALPLTAAEAPPAAGAVAGAPAWTVPAGWTLGTDERAMRFATFTAGAGDTAAEIVVSQFPGDVGGLLANVNRWRGQVGLEPVAEAQLPEVTQSFENPGFAGRTMRLKGADKHMLGAVITDPKGQRTWFIKCTAAPAVADVHEAAFLAFARSFGKAK